MCVFLSFTLLFFEKHNNAGEGAGEVERSEQLYVAVPKVPQQYWVEGGRGGGGEVKQVNCSRNIICAPSINYPRRISWFPR